jgi:hypothetical protein
MSNPLDQLNARRLFIYWKNTGLLDNSSDQARLASYLQEMNSHLKAVAPETPTDFEAAEIVLPIIIRLTDDGIWLPVPVLYKMLVDWIDNEFYSLELDPHMIELWNRDKIEGFLGYIREKYPKGKDGA